MSITTYQIQNVLRTYGRQLSRRDGLSRAARLSAASEEGEARSTVSAEAKRQAVIGRITKELVTRIAQHQPPLRDQGQEQAPGQDESRALQLLCAEYGRPLTVSMEDGVETFRVVDEQAGRLVPVPEAEAEKLRRRLYELTRGIVEENMLKA